MHFGLSDTQQSIKNSAREFFTAEAPMATVRKLADTPDVFDAALWKKCAEQGWTGIIFPEQYGGVGLGLVEMAAAWEEMGRALVPGPFVSTVLLSGTILDRAGSDAQKAKYLAPICHGDSRATLALLEKSASWDLDAVQLAATSAAGGGFELNGDKLFVEAAGVADLFLVACRINGELAIAAVPGTAVGVTKAALAAVDLTRPLYRISFQKVAVAGDAVIARGDRARAALEAAFDVSCVGLAAEMVGGMQQLVDLTVAYAKTREQFGRKIGSFQAVQHMCVDMFVLLEGSRSATYYAAWALNEQDADARVAVSVAKAYASDAYRKAGNLAIQVQGGMGFTWENDAHFHYRRAKGSELAFGDATFHRERIARLLITR
jgi:alkylation response protein AidB-like acyl-CoA dehydrogenase